MARATHEHGGTRGTGRREAAVLVLLLGVTAAVFAPLARAQFINFDDGLYVSENPHVRGGLTREGVRWAFRNADHALWAPLTWLSHMLDAQLFGVAGSVRGLPAAGWHHLTSLLLHLAATAALFRVLSTTTASLGRSALVAGLFALHPLHVEPVAWIASRKDVLSTCLGFLCLLAHVQQAQRPALRRRAVVFLLLALGLMAKPMLVTWPFLLLLLDFWPLRRLGRGQLRARLAEKTELFALVAAASVITYLAQRPAMTLTDTVPLSFRLQNALVAYLEYLSRTFWPADLAVFYPYPAAISPTRAALAVVVLGTLTVLCLRSARRHPPAATGWLWFAGTLVPVSGLIQIGRHAMADRFSYVPLVGLFVALVWSAAALLPARPAGRRAGAGMGLLALAACAVLSARQVRRWSDPVTLFRHTCAVTTDNGKAHLMLGNALATRGELEAAVDEFREALRILPRYAEAHESLGEALSTRGELAEGMQHLREAVRLDPSRATAHNRLGCALLIQGQVEPAIDAFRAALRQQPDDAFAHNNLATALANQGKLEEAVREYREALRLRPDLAVAHHFLGRALAEQGHAEEALAELGKAALQDPANVGFLDELAGALARAGRYHEAADTLELALRRGAGSPEMHEMMERRLKQYREHAGG